MTIKWCHICDRQHDQEIPEHLEQLLPEGHCHLVCSYAAEERGFTATLKLTIESRAEAEAWLEDFQKSSMVTFRVAKTYPDNEAHDRPRRNGYRVDLRCQHNIRQPGQTRKNTRCPAMLYLVIKKQSHSHNRKSRSSDGHISEGLLCYVTIKHTHNHRLDCAEALQQRDMASTPKEAPGRPDLKRRLQIMFDGLEEKLSQDEIFQAPIESLVSSYEKISTDSGLISALCSFGKPAYAAACTGRTKRRGLQMSTQMGVQPTAVACPKTMLGGRRALITGRPSKRARREEAEVKEGKSTPHNLAQCVTAGVALAGRGHSDEILVYNFATF